MMSGNTRRIEQERKAWLVLGQRDRGWAPDQLLRGPERVVLWSIPGSVLIIAFWAYTRFSGRAARDKEHEEDLKKSEEEVERLGDFRRGLGGRPAPKVEDDADTLAVSPPVRAKPPSASTRPRTTSRPAAKKRPTGQS